MDKSIEDAIRFISNELEENPDTNRSSLINRACQQFDLTPMQGEFLTNKFILEK